MNIVIDIGNTTTKVGIFNDKDLIAFERRDSNRINEIIEIIKCYNPYACIISSTSSDINETTNFIQNKCNGVKVIKLDYTTKTPLKNRYLTPETLGMDRIAAAVGAYSILPQRDILIIDAGTAITYDIVTKDGEYIGGNISAGIDLRFKALNEFTAKLPLVKSDGVKPFIGNNTETAIRCGILDGVKHEIEGFINQFTVKYPHLLVFLTGGTDFDFDERVKKRIFADKFLVLRGLNRILQEQAL